MNRGRHARVGIGVEYATEEERRCGALIYAVVRQDVTDATARRLLKRRGSGDTAPTAVERDSARVWLAGCDARTLAMYAGYPLRVVEAAARGEVTP